MDTNEEYYVAEFDDEPVDDADLNDEDPVEETADEYAELPPADAQYAPPDDEDQNPGHITDDLEVHDATIAPDGLGEIIVIEDIVDGES